MLITFIPNCKRNWYSSLIDSNERLLADTYSIKRCGNQTDSKTAVGPSLASEFANLSEVIIPRKS